MNELLVLAKPTTYAKGKGEEEWMPDWQFWAIASWFLVIFFRIDRIYDSVKEIKRDLAKQVKREGGIDA